MDRTPAAQTDIHLKKQLILEKEERFADALALRVIERPKLNIWMILIPIIFVYFFQRLQRFNAGRKTFTTNYMISRERALDAAAAAIIENTEPDVEKIVAMSDLTRKVEGEYRTFVASLIDYYTDILLSKGATFEELVRSAYRNRGQYLLILNRINRVERELNTALAPHIRGAQEKDIRAVIIRICRYAETLRRKDAERIFA